MRYNKSLFLAIRHECHIKSMLCLAKFLSSQHVCKVWQMRSNMLELKTYHDEKRLVAEFIKFTLGIAGYSNIVVSGGKRQSFLLCKSAENSAINTIVDQLFPSHAIHEKLNKLSTLFSECTLIWIEMLLILSKFCCTLMKKKRRSLVLLPNLFNLTYLPEEQIYAGFFRNLWSKRLLFSDENKLILSPYGKSTKFGTNVPNFWLNLRVLQKKFGRSLSIIFII